MTVIRYIIDCIRLAFARDDYLRVDRTPKDLDGRRIK